MSSHFSTHHLHLLTQREACKHSAGLAPVLPSSIRAFTWAVEQYVVVFHMTQALLQPVEVVGEILHAEDEAAVWAESERVVLHHVIHLDELSDV